MHIGDRIQDFTYYMKFLKTVIDGQQYDAPTLIKGVFHNIYYPAIEYIMLESDDESELRILFSKLNPVLTEYISDVLPENTVLEYSSQEYSPFYRIQYKNPYTLNTEEILSIDIREKGFTITNDVEFESKKEEIKNLQEEIDNLQEIKEEIIHERDYASDDTPLIRLSKKITRKIDFQEGMAELNSVNGEINAILSAIGEIEKELSALKIEKRDKFEKQEQVRLALIRNLGLHEIKEEE